MRKTRQPGAAAWRKHKQTLFFLVSISVCTAVGLFWYRESNADTIFVSVGAYRDKECIDTLADLFRKADRPEQVYVGAVTYTIEENTSSAERCEGSEVSPFERNIQRLHLNNSAGKGPNLSRYHGSLMYKGQKYFMQIDSHMKFAPGWDTELIRMIKAAPSRKPLLTHYPAADTDLDEQQVPVMCMASWMQEGIVRFQAVLEAAPRRNEFKPVPFVAGGFMFVPAWVMDDVPFDPELEYLFHGDEQLYSARLWTAGWDFFTPDKNVIFHHYGRENSPKFWVDFANEKEVWEHKAASIQRVLQLMNDTYDPTYQYGMGKKRSVFQWWEYADINPNDKSHGADGSKFCTTLRKVGPKPAALQTATEKAASSAQAHRKEAAKAQAGGAGAASSSQAQTQAANAGVAAQQHTIRQDTGGGAGAVAAATVKAEQQQQQQAVVTQAAGNAAAQAAGQAAGQAAAQGAAESGASTTTTQAAAKAVDAAAQAGKQDAAAQGAASAANSAGAQQAAGQANAVQAGSTQVQQQAAAQQVASSGTGASAGQGAASQGAVAQAAAQAAAAGLNAVAGAQQAGAAGATAGGGSGVLQQAAGQEGAAQARRRRLLRA